MSDIIYGKRNTDNRIISIDEVPVNMKGLLCDCVCAHCGKDLQACSLEGKVSRYFRHDNGSKKDIGHDWISNCNPITANETALHKMAKQIIAEEKRVLIPHKDISMSEAGIDDLPEEISRRIPRFEFQKAMTLYAETVELEKRLETFSPDILLKTKKGELLVEIFVSHQVDNDKKIKAREYGSAMLEIDLREFAQTPISSNELRDILMDSTSNRRWIFYPLTMNAIAQAKLFYEENELIKAYRKLILDEIKKSQREEYNRKRLNEKIKGLFEPENYGAKLKELRNDFSFCEFYKAHRKSFWFNFAWYYKTHKRVPFFIDIPISGEMIFQCDRRIWQSVIFNRYVYGRKEVGASFNIANIYDALKDDYGIAVDYDLSYKLINPLDEEKSIWLRREVIDKYMNYLETLGFISFEDDLYHEDGRWASTNIIKTIDPPRKQASGWLQYVIKKVNPYSPNISRLIDEKMDEYKEILVQELIEERNQRIAERERKIKEANERYEAQMRERAKQEEEERQRELLLQKQREEERIKVQYTNGLHDVESLDFSLPKARYDRYGYRWAKCIVCNCIKRDDELVSYQFGTGECNICRKD